MLKKTIIQTKNKNVIDKKGLDAVLKEIHAKFGEGAIMRMGSVERMKIETISNWVYFSRYCTWCGRHSKREDYRDIWT